MALYILYGVLAIFWLTSGAVSLNCHTCQKVTDIRNCTTFSSCAQNEKCFTRQHGVGSGLTFELGCATESECQQGSHVGLVGRTIRRQSACFQCCQTDRCNKNICTAGIHVINEVGQCEDDPKFDCSLIASSLNLCGDVHHAKVICRKYCGLCDLVDGSWSTWSQLSTCDVTCGSGHMTRARTCTDPAPAHGGLDCVGNATEIQPCVQKQCPVDGVWTDWVGWSGCSDTCGIGLQNRQRTCSNPKPSLDGNPCDGSPVEYKPCLLKGCNDGRWSDWESWSSCTHASIRSRTRQCNNPAPSRFDTPCIGNDKEYTECPRQVVAFSVTQTNRTLLNGHPVFTIILTNIGGGYDVTTGRFTCQIPGLYSFSASIYVSSPDQHVWCWLCKNMQHVLWVEGDSTNDSNDNGSIQTYLQLSLGDVVDLCGCTNWQNVNNGHMTSFRGALISAI